MIYLLRHGETIWNRQGRLQGQQDSPLTWRGINQARALGELLQREIADLDDFVLVCSPLGRAWQSAVIVAETLGRAADSIAQEPRLMEIGFGRWQGKTRAEVEADEPGAWAKRHAARWTHRPPGGESYALVAERVGAWLAGLPSDAKLIVVGHGLSNRVLCGLYAGLTHEEIYDLHEPQDAMFHLHLGGVQLIEA